MWIVNNICITWQAPVAKILSFSGNHVADTSGGSAMTMTPAAPFTKFPACAKAVKESEEDNVRMAVPIRTQEQPNKTE